MSAPTFGEILYCALVGASVAAWLAFGWTPGLIAMWILTFPVGYLATGFGSIATLALFGIGAGTPAIVFFLFVVGSVGVAGGYVLLMRRARDWLRSRAKARAS